MTDELRAELAEAVADEMIAEMTFEEMRACVWDARYDDLVHQPTADLLAHAERYGLPYREGR
jgi:hypothetical protein